MSTIEPTEEQREAALRFCKDHSVCGNGWLVDEFTVAELLAEREAKLREVCVCIGVETGRAERDALRARVALVCIERDNLEESEAQHLARIAELEASRDHPRTWAAVEAREAQHLADIKALSLRVVSLHKRCLRLDGGAGFDGACVECVGVDDVPEHLRDFRCWKHTPLPTAHYDDAKAAGYFDKAREVAREVAAWPDWKKAGFRPGDTEGGEG